MRKKHGFTLVEVLVTVAILSILTSITLYGFNAAKSKARDADRKADLRSLQSAIELYRQKNGRYPDGCNGASAWSGQIGTAYACPGGSSQYIVGLAPQFIPTLPVDPKLNGSDSGYIYTTNTDGTVYKIMAKKTVESHVVQIDNEFESCDISSLAGVNCDPHVVGRNCDVGICDRLFTGDQYSSQGSKPAECASTDNQFRTSYGLSGGYATPTATLASGTEGYTANVERLTEQIACKI